MDNFLKVLPIFSAIITITLGLLSLSQKFKNEGAFRSLFTIALCITPFIFIQQIIQFTSKYFITFCIYFGVIVFIFLVITIYKIRELSKKHKQSDFDKKVYLSCLINLISLLIITIINVVKYIPDFYFCGHQFSFNKSDYIADLSTYKIKPEMYYFLGDKIQITAFYVIISAIMVYQICVFISMYLNLYKIYNYTLEEKEFSDKYASIFIFSFALALVCCDLPSIIESVFGLFA